MSNKDFEISKRTFFLGLIGVLLLSSIISYGLISATSMGGLIGPQGEIGPEGPQGEVGPEGPQGVTVVERQPLPDVKNIGTTVQNLGRIIIDAPTTGYVVLALTATVVTLGDQTSCNIGLATTDSSFDLHRTGVGVIDGTSNQRNIYSAASHAVVSVLPGEHTFYVNAQKSTVFNLYEVNIDDIFISAIFYSNVN